MKILIFSPWGDDTDLDTVRGTPENAYLLNTLLERGHEVIFVCQGKFKGEHREGLKVYEVPLYPFLRPGFINYFVAPLLNPLYGRRIKNLFEDLVNSHSVDLVLNIGGYAHREMLSIARSRRIPYVVKLMGTIEFAKGTFSPLRILQYYREFLVFRYKPDFYLLVNDGTLSHEIARKFGVREEKYLLLPNPRPDIEVEKSVKRGDETVVGYFSRFDKLKGTDLFVRIARMVLRMRKDVRFIIAGDGPMKPLVNKLMGEFPAKVEYRGFLPYKDLLALYSEIDILVSTNRYSNATLQVIEAMNFGIPVVAFDVLGTSEIVRDNQTGFLVRPWNLKEFTLKLIELLDSPEKRNILGGNAKEFIRKNIPTWKERMEMEVKKLEEICDAGD